MPDTATNEPSRTRQKGSSRTTVQWLTRPDLPDTHYLDTRVYTDPAIYREEVDKIWRKV